MPDAIAMCCATVNQKDIQLTSVVSEETQQQTQDALGERLSMMENERERERKTAASGVPSRIEALAAQHDAENELNRCVRIKRCYCDQPSHSNNLGVG